jgi:hypothetical protein
VALEFLTRSSGVTFEPLTTMTDTITSVLVSVPIRIVSEMNSRDHWRVRNSRFAEHHEAVHYTLRPHRATLQEIASFSPTITVTLTRIGPRLLDDDNLASGFKKVRDSVAEALGLNDDPASRIKWRYEQRQDRQYSAEIQIEGTND